MKLYRTITTLYRVLRNIGYIRFFLSRNFSIIVVFTLVLCLLNILLDQQRSKAHRGVYFQYFTSETLMQTVSIEDLRDEPFRSLWYLHVSPPMLDGIRASVAPFFDNLKGMALVYKVDGVILKLWTGVYALMGALLFAWVTKSYRKWLGCVATALFLLHPALIFYATMIDTTIISSLGVLWLFYELRRISHGKKSIWGLHFATLFLFFTRSTFQWPFVVVVCVSLLCLRLPLKKVVLFFAITGIVTVGYTIKQYCIFGVPYSSTFAGYNFCRSIGGCPALPAEAKKNARDFLNHHPRSGEANVLSRPRKLRGTNFNALAHLKKRKKQQLAYQNAMFQRDFHSLLLEYVKNVKIYLKPSSDYTKHRLVDSLPWRKLYDAVFSSFCLVILLGTSSILWLMRNRTRDRVLNGVGFLLPALYTFFVTVLFERGENQRFKFFLEPIFYLFIFSQISALFVWSQTSKLLKSVRHTS